MKFILRSESNYINESEVAIYKQLGFEIEIEKRKDIYFGVINYLHYKLLNNNLTIDLNTLEDLVALYNDVGSLVLNTSNSGIPLIIIYNDYIETG